MLEYFTDEMPVKMKERGEERAAREMEEVVVDKTREREACCSLLAHGYGKREGS